MAFEKNEDKRRFHRIFFDASALLEGTDTLYRCNIVDISLKGSLLNFEEPWVGSLESLYKLTLNLTDDINIVMEVSVSHVIGNQVGFKCEHIDIESISRLRRLVELNLGDSELLERELAALSDLGTQPNNL